MPEGDTVFRTARHLDAALSGRVLVETDFRVPAHATLDLSGHRVLETVARGKHLLTRIDARARDAGANLDPPSGRLTLHTHLKMEGSWHLYRAASRWQRPAHQARVVLRTDEWTAVGFSLGIVEVVETASEPDVVGHLGPDLLAADWDAAEAVRRLRSDPGRPIGAALLDQRNLAGVGNMYMCELCFLLGVNPWLPVRDVPDLARLVDRAQLVLAANKDRPAQTTTGDTRRGRQLWVYRRDDQACRRCGSQVRVAPLNERATYWCPSCQPGPVGGAGSR